MSALERWSVVLASVVVACALITFGARVLVERVDGGTNGAYALVWVLLLCASLVVAAPAALASVVTAAVALARRRGRPIAPIVSLCAALGGLAGLVMLVE